MIMFGYKHSRTCTYLPTHLLTHLLTHSLTHLLAHVLTVQENQPTRDLSRPAQFLRAIDFFFAENVRAQRTLTAQLQHDE